MFISNTDLQKNIIDELAFDPSIDERNVAVAAKDGIVTLTGSVTSYAQTMAAEKAAKRVRGVHGIAEELTIDLPEFHKRNDADLAGSVLQALRWNATIPIDTIFVKVEIGWVTLTGTIDWQFQREAACLTAASIAGVRGVTSEIAIRKQVAVSDRISKIQTSFRRNAEMDASRVVVESNEGVITLRGAVHSWAEHEDAAIAAYSIAGVSDVKNLTTVS